MWALTKTFRFEAAHTLERDYGVEIEASRRIHGHSYRAEVTVEGAPDPSSGMIVDLGAFEASLRAVTDALDHRLLDGIEGLGPATMENLSRWIFERLDGVLPGVAKVTVFRDSQGEMCSYAPASRGQRLSV